MSVLPNVEKTGIADKMSLLFKSNDSSWIDVDFSDWNVEQKNFFDKIRDSIIERFALKLKYINSNGKISERIAEPLKVNRGILSHIAEKPMITEYLGCHE